MRRINLQMPMAGTLWISIACLSGFIVQRLAGRVTLIEGRTFEDVFTLSFGIHAPLLFAGFIWQPLSYMFLHGSIAHLVLNLASLFVVGRVVEQFFGTRRFLAVFFIGGIVGGLGWLCADLFLPPLAHCLYEIPGEWAAKTASWIIARCGVVGGRGVCIGASAGVCGLVGALAAVMPQRRSAWLMVVLTLGEPLLRGASIAHSAHVFGCIAGYFLGRCFLRNCDPICYHDANPRPVRRGEERTTNP